MDLFNPLGAEAQVFQLALEELLSGTDFPVSIQRLHIIQNELSVGFCVSFAHAEDVSSPSTDCT